MDRLDGHRAQLHSELGAGLDAFQDLLAQELTKKLDERDSFHAAEKRDYQQEIITLRNQAARVEGLEAENRKLAAELSSSRQADRGKSISKGDAPIEHTSSLSGLPGSEAGTEAVSIEEYRRVKDQLAKSDRDYGKVVYARQFLESKVRYYKDMTKQWREYTTRWIMKHPKKQRRPLDLLRVSPGASITDPRSSSAPSPPPIPDGPTPSVSDASRANSPWNGSMLGHIHPRSPSRNQSGSPKLTDRIIATQLALDNDYRASSAGLTEATGDSGSETGKTNEPPVDQNLDPECAARTDEDDSPIIISERSLKRKRAVDVHEDTDPVNPVSLKNETHSSSPIAIPNSHDAGAPHDSLDLDDVGGHVITPRKRRKLEQIRLRSSKMSPRELQNKETTSGDSISKYSRSDPTIKLEQVQPTSAVHSPHPPEARGNDENQASDKHQRSLRKASSRAQQQAHNNRVHKRLESTLRPFSSAVDSSVSNDTSLRADCDPGRPSGGGNSGVPVTTEYVRQPYSAQGQREIDNRNAELPPSTILQPMDPNAHILPRTNGRIANQKPSWSSSRRDRGAAYVPALAEDGDDSPAMSHKSNSKHVGIAAPSDNPSKESDAHRRLGTLLSEPSPEKSSLEPKPNTVNPFNITPSTNSPSTRPNRYTNSKAPTTPVSISAMRFHPDNNANSKTDHRRLRKVERPILEGNKSVQAASKAPSKNSLPYNTLSRDQPSDDLPEHEPFRSRPIHRLRIDNFKLNPAHSDYAYHESVRKHDEKKRVSGCTDRHCPRCKDIRKFVENSGYANMPGQNTEETDRRLIADYIGGDRRRLNEMSAAERKEVLAQAKMQQFADKFGKHKTFFTRAPSPVDYWNTDFPSTQEQENNREAVRLREREKVQEVYWEAIRKGGRYMFADE